MKGLVVIRGLLRYKNTLDKKLTKYEKYSLDK